MLRRQVLPALMLITLFVIFALPFSSDAQTAFSKAIVPCNGTDCTVCHLATLAQNVLNTGIYMAVVLSAVLFAWAGWLAVTAGGSSEQIGKARSIFTNVTIGLVIILAGWLVVDTLMRAAVKSDSRFGPWNRICSVAPASTISS